MTKQSIGVAYALAAHSGEAGHLFQSDAGHLFRYEGGHHSDLMPAIVPI